MTTREKHISLQTPSKCWASKPKVLKNYFRSVKVQTLQDKLRKAEEGRARAEAAALSWKNAYENKSLIPGLW